MASCLIERNDYLYIIHTFKVIKIYEKFREPTPSSHCVDSWEIKLVERMT